jgi:hypothetical protein
MANASYTSGLLGALCGVLLALFAIFIGSGTVRWFGESHESAAVHENH